MAAWALLCQLQRKFVIVGNASHVQSGSAALQAPNSASALFIGFSTGTEVCKRVGAPVACWAGQQKRALSLGDRAAPQHGCSHEQGRRYLGCPNLHVALCCHSVTVTMQQFHQNVAQSPSQDVAVPDISMLLSSGRWLCCTHMMRLIHGCIRRVFTVHTLSLFAGP